MQCPPAVVCLHHYNSPMTPRTSKGLLFTPNTGVFNEISPSAQSIFRGKASSPANAYSYDVNIISSTKVPDISPSLTDFVRCVHIVTTIRDQHYDVLVVRSVCVATGWIRQDLRPGEVQSLGDVSIGIRVWDTCDLNEKYSLLNKRHILVFRG